MTTPTEDEVIQSLLVIGNALGSQAQQLHVAAAISAIETALDEARKDREELAVWRLAGEQCVEIQRDYADNGEPVGYAAQLAPQGFAALSDWHLGETPFGAVRAAIDQARGA